MRPVRPLLALTLVLAVALAATGLPGATPAAAQTAGQTYVMIEDFEGSNGVFWNPQSNPYFNHSFTLPDEWDGSGWFPDDPMPPSPSGTFTLYALNEDRITFNLPGTASVTEAQIWGWGAPSLNGGAVGRGRVVFEGTGDTKTFTFSGATKQWTLFKASETDLGDNGRLLGAIAAIRLKDMGGIGSAGPFFDSLRIVAVTPPRRADLALTMSGPTSPLTPGSTVSYDLTVTNSGPEGAPGVVIEDVLPYGGTFVAGGSSSACQLINERVRCDLGTLTVGAAQTVTIAVQVGGATCATFANRASVTARAYDSNLANNTAVHTATTSNPACADFAVELTAGPVPVDPEVIFTYTLTVRNAGPDTAGATVSATLPYEVFQIGIASDAGVTCSGQRQISCTVAPLAPGQQAQVFVTAKLSIAATGLIETTAAVTPAINDPRSENNTTRFRFTGGTAYTYTLIAEAGVGALANYDEVHGVDMNENGEVAFWASHGNGVDGNNTYLYDDWAAFVGDGTTTTRRFGLSDLTPVAEPLQQVWGSCLSINDAGWLATESVVFDSTDTVLGHTSGNVLHLIDPSGARVQLASASQAVDGSTFERYGNPVLNNLNQVLATVHTSDTLPGVSLLLFAGGQRTELYHTDNRIDNIGLNDRGDYAFVEAIRGYPYTRYKLWVYSHWGSSVLANDILPHDTRPVTTFFGPMTLNNQRQVAYSQLVRDTSSGLIVENFHTVSSSPAITWGSIAAQTEYGHRVNQTGINDQGRYAYSGAISAMNRLKIGIFTGPNFLANRVVAFSSTVLSGWGTYLLGSTAHDDRSSCTIPINNAGQVAFSALLDDGRFVVVRADPTRDNDGDGVTDWDELGAPNSGDGNGDGIPDSVQPNVTSVANSVDGRAVTFVADPNYTLTSVRAVANPAPGSPPAGTFSLGYFAFELTDLPAGGSATVTVTLPGAGVQSWWKYGPTPGNPTPHWYDFSYDGTTGAEINGNIVTLHFVDGGRGDSDLAANGTIVDPGGPLGYPYATHLPLVAR
ncbi:DUF11 domain-containing protein [Oscillochloris sp. ZM17-4]|uniref:DUF11 domain-containing protein n=1 Tax=Oscillochloris sp. ZM17-4 TaxID=2866714 RepID=UPI001C72FBA9|nr:DUF11 domain-containing protein [Oscillochloris sp. ZM17-4]MBX0327492.1 DUF11 domain-containing protein [Oscillochloris sp. ZM17-4]